MNKENSNVHPALSLGADVEVFLIDENYKYISAINKIPGTKAEPYPTSHGSIQWDNVLAEFNTVPAYGASAWYNNVLGAYYDLHDYALSLGLQTKIVASATLDMDQLNTYEAFILGCEPDFDAWGMDDIKKIDPMELGGFRSAGGHIHVGGPFAIRNRESLVRTLDLVIGLPSILLDKDTHRRKLYGMCGRYRPKPYGIEYRVPSNFWIGKSSTINWIWKTIYDVVLLEAKVGDSLDYKDALVLKEAINTSNTKVVTKLISKYGISVPQ